MQMPDSEPKPKPQSKRRAANGEPKPHKRADGRWALYIELEPMNGKRRRLPVYGSSPDAVRTAAKTARADLAEGDGPADKQTTLKAYFTAYLKRRRPDGHGKVLAPHSHRDYTYQAETSIIPYLGHIAVGKLTRRDVARWLDAMADDGKGGRTIQFAHAVLHKALADAKRRGMVTRNVADDPDLGGPRRNIPEPWTEDHARAFLAGLADDPDLTLYLTSATTGLRPAELLALRWSKLDLALGVLVSTESLTEWEGKRYAKDNKSEAGRRTLPTSEDLVDLLNLHRIRQDAERAAFGPTWRDNDFVFPNPDGGPRRPDTLSKQFARKTKRLGLPHIRLYDLRRFNVSETIAETKSLYSGKAQAGHSSIALTADSYAYQLLSISKPAIEAISRRIYTPAAVKLAVNGPPKLRLVPDVSTNPVDGWDPSI